MTTLNKKITLSRLLIIVMTFSMFLGVRLSLSFAEPRLFEGYGECEMGNTGVESIDVAQRKARDEAYRNASEKAGVFVHSISEMKDHELTKDQVTVLSAHFLKIEYSEPEIEPIPGTKSTVRVKCHAKVWIDPEEFMQKVATFTREKIEDQVKMSKDQDSYREKNEAEIVNLREQYEENDDENKRQEIAVAIKHNEEKFTASHFYKSGSEFYNKGDLAEAIKWYNKAIELDDKYAAPWTGLGWIYNDQEQYAKAVECFQKSIELYDAFAVPYNGLAYAYNYNKNYDKAIEYGSKAVQLDPDYAAAWNNIGLAYNNLGEYAKATEYYKKAIAIAPNDDVPLANLGNVFYKQKDFEKAFELYQKSTRINPNHASVWYNLGNIYGQKNEFDKAIDSYKKVTSLDPQNIRAWIILGYLYNDQKKFEDAKKCFKKAIKINSTDALAWAGLGFAYDGSEDYANSYEAYKKASELDPTNENFKKSLEISKQKL